MKQNENGKKIKETIKNRMSWIGSWKSWSKRHKLTTGICGVCVIVVVAGAIGLSGGSDTEVIYKETTVKYGTLVKGVTESGSVDIGTVDQTFDLDMSALQRTDTSGSSSSGGSSGVSCSPQPARAKSISSAKSTARTCFFMDVRRLSYYGQPS